jgi:hypothetical protein
MSGIVARGRRVAKMPQETEEKSTGRGTWRLGVGRRHIQKNHPGQNAHVQSGDDQEVRRAPCRFDFTYPHVRLYSAV